MRTVSAVRAAVEGVILALRAPGLLLATLLLTMITAAPFVWAVETPVMRSLAMQPPVAAISASEIDAEWWMEFRRHATGLAATFTPAILGFAAPLDSVSGLLDGTTRPLALAIPVLVAAVVWAFLWGGILHRFASGSRSPRDFVSAAVRHFGRLTGITVVAAIVNVILYLSIHPLLLRVVYGAISSRMSSERDAFVTRVALYLVFGALLVLVNAVFSFARIHVVANGERRISAAISRAIAFVRSRAVSVLSLYVIFLVIFAAAMAAYGSAEILGASRIGGWRAVVVGQAFIVFRLGMRLALGASQVRLASRELAQ